MLEKIIQVVSRLRAEDGCPWDRVQTHKSLCSYIKEEVYEVIDAIEKQDMENLKEELGDLLFHIVMQSSIAEEEQEFTLEDVIEGICKKMIWRHPNVFGTAENTYNWDELKQIEKGMTTPMEEIKAVPLALPACIRAQKVQKKAEKLGYCSGKVQESITSQEVGKELFELLNRARISGINGEEALNEYTKIFVYNIEQKKCLKNL